MPSASVTCRGWVVRSSAGGFGNRFEGRLIWCDQWSVQYEVVGPSGQVLRRTVKRVDKPSTPFPPEGTPVMVLMVNEQLMALLQEARPRRRARVQRRSSWQAKNPPGAARRHRRSAQ